MKLLILVLIGYLAYRALKSWVLNSSQQRTMQGNAAGEIDDDMVKDPYCGVYFAQKGRRASETSGERYLFLQRSLPG